MQSTCHIARSHAIRGNTCQNALRNPIDGGNLRTNAHPLCESARNRALFFGKAQVANSSVNTTSGLELENQQSDSANTTSTTA